MKKVLLLSLLLLLTIYSESKFYCGTTGKLSGKVIDAESREPMPGVNVVIEGTTIGAATDIDGIYIINNITPGTYSVNFSAVGYQKQQFINVKIAADFTTTIDVELSTEAITVGTIVVEAKAPLIRTDLTSSQATIDAGQIRSLPVENVSQVISLQAGVTVGVEGELHMRGGRSNEISYTVNGVSISNPFDNTKTVQIATNAIQELSVVSGTFNAEYGNALSGVVNTVTKEGSDKVKGHVSFYAGDYFSNQKSTFPNIDKIDALSDKVAEFTIGGPIINKFSFFVSGRFDENAGYLYGIRQHNPWDSIYVSKSDPNDIRVTSTGDNSYVAMNPSREKSGTAKLTFKPIPSLKINYDAIYSDSYDKFYNHDYRYNPDANYNYYEWGLLNSLEIRHAVNQKTFYTLRGAYNFNDSKQYLYPLLDASGNAVSFYPGKSLDGLTPDPAYQPSHKTTTPTSYMFVPGGTRNYHSYERTKTMSAKFDITSQINVNHEIKFGLEGKLHRLELQNFTILRDSVTYKEATIPAVNSAYHDAYFGDNARKPMEFSAYLQDKMEYRSLIMNVGLRYDYFFSNAKYSTNTFYPTEDFRPLPAGFDTASIYADAKAKHQISPRIGISFPITDRGIIHFSYGHFFQMPPFQYLYSNPDFKTSVASGDPLFGNPNLNPEKTVTYELGLQQQLMEDLAFNVTGYFKDVRDLLATQTIRVSGDKTYQKFVNKDYGSIKGITFSLTKRRTQESILGVSLDYTFQVSEGNDVNSDAFFVDLSSGKQTEKVVIFLPWDQTHNLNTSISLGKSEDWNVSLIGRIGTGLPYTPQNTGKMVYLRSNSGRRPITSKVDLFAEKSFKLFNNTLVIFLKVFNLFDTLNERLVYEDTGRATYTLVQVTGGAQAVDDLAARIPGLHTSSEYFNRPNYYSAPRQILAGFSIEF